MQLSVPQRTVADTGSFPVNPDGVAQWLAKLDPLESELDAREVYRGLKHSNRLHNDVNQRRRVVSCFVPVLRELNDHLSEISNAQPLPLTREFSRYARLRDALLREEAFAFKILLSDSEVPLADDARRAMQALARQAESVVNGYRVLPDALIEDAHQLYALAEEHTLLSNREGSDLLSVQDHYRFILLLSIADLSQQRARQLPLVADFLRGAASEVHIERQRTADSIAAADYAMNLTQGSRPEPAMSLLPTQVADIRWFSVAPVLYRIDATSRQLNAGNSSVPGSDALEKQSLTRLALALTRSRERRNARSICYSPSRVVIGHKEICANLLHPSPLLNDHESPWVVVNQTLNGVCLHIKSCRAGTIQVGELVSINETEPSGADSDDQQNHKVDVCIGVIRWVHASHSQNLSVGIEFLARSVMPVHVTRNGHEYGLSFEQNFDDGPSQIAESALIIACKIQNKVLQTILLPSYLYHEGDKLIATQGIRSREVVLRQCLQSNGLFSQYSLADG